MALISDPDEGFAVRWRGVGGKYGQPRQGQSDHGEQKYFPVDFPFPLHIPSCAKIRRIRYRMQIFSPLPSEPRKIQSFLFSAWRAGW
jgi:hypothetical protein